ncbi:HAD family hydrolase [Carboxydochorda subterranea]|uniref:HAD family hydrolase n=1 Tax=Carboxydichorda subterranea TaxID=3109565 RepID=A0ABZ1C1W2_9FIRM|nr:HAD family hydrolase [Limnochorda sp. L945t]WRP18268.1 HAD family hydrolase [Limnochorda sp. L945t]
MRGLVLFDLDGTLVNSGGAGRRAIQRAWGEVFGQEVALDPGWTAGRTDPAIFREMARVGGIEPRRWEAERARLVDRYLAYLCEEVASRPGRVLPGVLELLRRGQQEARWALALATGNLERGARLKLSPFDLNRYFPVGGFGSDSEVRHELLQVAVRRAQEHFGEAMAPVVVGDTPLDVEAAHRAGMAAVAVATGPYGMDDLARAGAEAVLPSLEDTERALHAVAAWMLRGRH